ncbi:MAG: LysR family transcriptional regulator ArgP [Desulfuromusa sp.]|jgi:LysR family transcriptional regulator (chromosome initiation inhibitor)|nr:LysR family transcriptional regulator ArgP [Desulfuromusa sp.]
MIDYKLLEALAMVVHESGFEKAASVMNLTQSAISQRVRLLEERTGKILLSRASPPQPTDAGQQLIKHYLQVKLLEDGIEKEMSGDDAMPIRLAMGINADSLASWFLPAIGKLLSNGKILIDMHVDDQEQTHKLLRDGVVVGCISDTPSPMQGCKVEFLGSMNYRLLASKGFISQWFPNGLTVSAAENAPAVLFNRKDMLHNKILQHVLGATVKSKAIHYVPANEQFMQMISSGYAYGMAPDWQSNTFRKTGEVVEVDEKAQKSVKHYWHCWNIESLPLNTLSKLLVSEAKNLLT